MSDVNWTEDSFMDRSGAVMYIHTAACSGIKITRHISRTTQYFLQY